MGFWSTYSIDVILEGKRKRLGQKPPRKKMGYRIFADVNRIGRPRIGDIYPHFARAPHKATKFQVSKNTYP